MWPNGVIVSPPGLIIVHPNVMYRPQEWARLGDRLCIENMDKRKPVGQTASDLVEIFQGLPNATFCFDIGHARQVDPTRSEASTRVPHSKFRAVCEI